MHSRLATLIVAALFAVASVLTASPAHAATTGSFSGGVLTLKLGPNSNLQVSSDYDGGYTVQDYNNEINSLPGCASHEWRSSWTCTGITLVKVTGTSGADDVSLEGDFVVEARLGAGDDNLYVTDARKVTAYGEGGNDFIYIGTYDQPNLQGSHLDGGDGNDTILSGAGNDTLVGGAGNDTLVGAPGNDTLLGGDGQDELFGDNQSGDTRDDDGNDVLDGGPGDDILVGSGGADTFRGGAGNDTVSYERAYDYDINRTFSATLDGLANDGEAGERDNINADGSVENIILPNYGNWTSMNVVGDDGPNRIEGTSSGKITIDARGGDDTVIVGSGTTGSSKTILGGHGNDTISAWGPGVHIDGGPGNDTLTGHDGNDTIIGGPGTDSIDGRKGNDTIDAADGEMDSISCGEGADTLRADAVDVYDFTCEAVTVVKAPTPTPKPTPTPTPAPKPTPKPKPKPGPKGKVTYQVAKQTKATKKGVFKVRARSTFGKPVKVRVVVRSTKPKRKVAQKTVTVRPKGSVINVKLNKKALRTLKKQKRMRVQMVFTVTKGGKGRTTRTTVLLRR